jgi:hypothetical protein
MGLHVQGREGAEQLGIGAVHAFPVAIGSRARFLNIHTPNLDFDGYLRKLNEMRAGARSRTTSS